MKTLVVCRFNKRQNCRYENVGCGGTFTVACTRDGKIYSWGKSTRGQLGRTSLSVINPPQLVNVKFNSTYASDQVKVVSLAVNHAGTIAVVSGWLFLFFYVF